MNNVISLVPYYGGASKMVEVMRYLMESAHELGCTKLVETMSGSGVISINRKRVYFPEATLIEMDKGMGTLLKSMTDPVLFSQLIVRLKMAEPSPDRFRLYQSWKENNFIIPRELPLADIAEAQYYLSCLSRNGAQKSYKKNKTKDKAGNTIAIRKPLSIYDRLHNLYEVRERLEGCTVYNDNFLNRILDYIHDEHCLIIIDPPFLESLRRCMGQYVYEWEDITHQLLIDLLTNPSYIHMDNRSIREILLGQNKPDIPKEEPKAKIVLFGFENEMYTKMFTSAKAPWYQFILERPLLASNKKIDDKKEMQRKSFWINFLPSEYAKTYVLELNHLIYLTPEKLEENLKRDREFKKHLIGKYGKQSNKNKSSAFTSHKVKDVDKLRLFYKNMKNPIILRMRK